MYNSSQIGMGTYPLVGALCSEALEHAIAMGYRIIDTATLYGNFDALGSVLKKYDRHNFYIISKVWPDSHTPLALQKDLRYTLQHLSVDYLDAYLLHWPNSKVAIADTLYQMQQFVDQGFVKAIGLSNITIHHLMRALEVGVPIACVQVEMNPLFYDAQLIEFCHERSIQVQAWAPLARGRVNQNHFLLQLGEKYHKTATQIALRWVLRHNCIPLVGTKNADHLRQNKEILDFEIVDEDMMAIDATARAGQRERLTVAMGLGFSDEFDFSYDECWPKK